MHSKIDVNHAPLPGYRLIERIGAGGYGEVWRAEAPGGLTKAIKFVFGQEHEKRATRELRALELIKQLRHPFLLSLERIEVTDGRLVIVSELADGSVKDRFDACVREKLPGIPRDELLRYLRDAADALDYMNETHGLQHLDIKPENLLILAEHVKVADFGLVKDIKQSVASLVGGMTPLYAAPEVFRGQPSRQSDQYSLAIVYQEMLTGSLPFVGSNAAELTLQHLNDEPDLSSLSGADRYVVSRALSKDPSHRYFTCRELVEALLTVAPEGAPFATSKMVPRTLPPAWSAETTPKASAATELFDDEAPCGGRDASLLIALPPSDRVVSDLPTIDADPETFRPSPTFFLGVGGAAGRVLSHLRRRLHDQFDGRPLPAMQMLLVDTDPRGLADAIGSDGRGLTVEETLNVPLRRPQHYRARWDQLLCWLSRRWLYNIPKSMRTEGLRPLGRLAFVDHARQTCQRIRRAMLQAADEEAVSTSAAAIGQELHRDRERIYIVAAVSGGTGSGMVLDIAYAVRAMVKKLALPEVNIIGILLHATGHEPRHCELSRVNAYSWLTEFCHFHQPGSGYPGDVSCGLPSHGEGVPAFDQAYLLHLGECLDEAEFEQATQSIAEYLRLDAFTPAQVFLDAGRQTTADSAAADSDRPGVNLRSFGVYCRTPVSSGCCEEAAAAIGSHLLATWRKPAAEPAITAPLTMAIPDSAAAAGNDGGDDLSPADKAHLVRRLQLTPAGLAANARLLIDAELGSDVATYLTSWFAQRLSADQSSEANQFAAVDEVFGGGKFGDDDAKPSILGHAVAEVVAPLTEKLRSEIRRWVIRRLDDPQQRLAGASRSLSWLSHHVQAGLADIQQLQRNLAKKIIEASSSSAPGPADTRPNAAFSAGVSERALGYFRLRLERLALVAADQMHRTILSDLQAIGDELTAFGRELTQMAAAVGSVPGTATPSDPAAHVGAATGKPPRSTSAIDQTKLAALAAEVDKRVQSEYLDCQGGLFQTVMQGGRPRAQLCAKLHEFARQSAQRALAGFDAMGPTDRANEAASPEGRDLRAGLSSATPALLEFGGARRVLAIVPRTAAPIDREQLSQALGTNVSTVVDSADGVTLCVEAEQLSIPQVAVNLVQKRRDSVEFAKRVHSRSDVAWTPLLASPTDSEAFRGPTVVALPFASGDLERQTEVV